MFDVVKNAKDANKVTVRGKVNSMDLEVKSYTDKNGQNKEMIAGTVEVRVELNGEAKIIPIRVFANKMTAAGAVSKLFQGWQDMLDKVQPISAVGLDAATRVSIQGELGLNEYSKNGEIKAIPVINGRFVGINPNDATDEASWEMTFAVGGADYIKDKEGIDTSVFEVKALIPKYDDTVIAIPVKVMNPQVIDIVKSYWAVESTVHGIGSLDFNATTENYEVESDFGDPIVKQRTIHKSDIVLTNGKKLPFEPDFAMSVEELKQGRLAHKAYTDNLIQKEKDSKNAAKPSSKSPATSFDW